MNTKNHRRDQPRRPGRPRGRLILAAVVLLLAGLVWLSPAFRLQHLVLPDDLRQISAEELAGACGLEPGRHLLAGLGGSVAQLATLRYGAAEARARAQLPALKSIELRLGWPGRIICQIEERVEVAYVAIPDGVVMIDKEGYALRIWPQPPAGIPVIEGVSATLLLLGAELSVDVPAAMQRAITLMGAIIEADRDPRPETILLPQIRRIRPLGSRQLYLTLVIPDTGEEMTVLTETGAGQTENMLWLRFALDQDALNGRGKGILDLTGSNRVFIPD
jgi:cell division septal protein FtsQ